MKVTITNIDSSDNYRIRAIKTIRALTGLGLAESKNIIDSVVAGEPQTVTILSSHSTDGAKSYLHQEGFEFKISRWERFRSRLPRPPRPPRVRLISGMRDSVPFYVTRPTADGLIGQLSMNSLVALVMLLLVSANVIVWALVGLYEAVRVVFG